MQGSTLIAYTVLDFNSRNVNFNAQGVIGSAVPMQTTYIDLKMLDDNFLTGGHLRVFQAAFGDYVDLQIVDKDGYFATLQPPGAPVGVTYNMLPGYPILNQFVTKWILSDDDSRQADFDLSYPAKLLTNMYIRIVYHSVGAMMPRLAMNYDLHKCMV